MTEGQHGILRNTNSGVEFPVTHRGTWDYQIDGSSGSNWFEEQDGWEFTPDPPVLPTAPGLYAVRDDPTPFNSRHLLLTSGGEWYWLDFTAGEDKILEPAYGSEKNYTLNPVFT